MTNILISFEFSMNQNIDFPAIFLSTFLRIFQDFYDATKLSHLHNLFLKSFAFENILGTSPVEGVRKNGFRLLPIKIKLSDDICPERYAFPSTWFLNG